MSEEIQAQIDHRKIAAELFNMVWELMGKTGRTIEESDKMLHAAHASRYHWGVIGKPVNLARGEWQVSRVYAVLERSEPALYHAQRCLDICQQNNIGDFDLAYAYEALARATAITGNLETYQQYDKLAQQAAEQIAEAEDKKMLFDDLATIHLKS
jgi:hypothetical protein